MYQANFAGARRPPGKLREAALPPDGHVGEILHGRPLPGQGSLPGTRIGAASAGARKAGRGRLHHAGESDRVPV